MSWRAPGARSIRGEICQWMICSGPVRVKKVKLGVVCSQLVSPWCRFDPATTYLRVVRATLLTEKGSEISLPFTTYLTILFRCRNDPIVTACFTLSTSLLTKTNFCNPSDQY